MMNDIRWIIKGWPCKFSNHWCLCLFWVFFAMTAWSMRAVFIPGIKFINVGIFNSILGCCVVSSVIMHMLHHHYVHKCHLFEIYGSHWYGQLFSKKSHCHWCRCRVEAGSLFVACAPGAYGAEEEGRGTPWKKTGHSQPLSLKGTHKYVVHHLKSIILLLNVKISILGKMCGNTWETKVLYWNWRIPHDVLYGGSLAEESIDNRGPRWDQWGLAEEGQ